MPGRTTSTTTARSRPKANAGAGPGPGEPFPPFRLRDQTGRARTLADLRGAPAVIYFYPEADTPVCTGQACGIRDVHAALARLGARVFAVSPDEPAALAAFAAKFDLPFTLLSDPPARAGEDPPLMTSIGVWGEKRMYGNLVRGVIRTTFVLDSAGVIVHRWPNVRTPGHGERVLRAVEALAGGT